MWYISTKTIWWRSLEISEVHGYTEDDFQTFALDIDTEMDWRIAEGLISHIPNNEF